MPSPACAAGQQGAKKEWRNPFLPYEQALWVANLGGAWLLPLLRARCKWRTAC